jgi:hypothetical protein
MINLICYNCGSDEAGTTEHVIARTLIPEPRPNNLITVPGCRSCNEAISLDEEYLRDRLSAAVGGPDCEAPPTWDVAWRSMQRDEARGKKLAFFKDALTLSKAVQTKSGLSNMAIQLETRRVNRVIEKMVRGFYFHFFKNLLGDVEFQIDMLSSVNPGGDRTVILQVMDKIYESPTWAKNFGPYTSALCSLAEDNDRAGIWCFKLFGQHIAVAVVGPKEYFERAEPR